MGDVFKAILLEITMRKSDRLVRRLAAGMLGTTFCIPGLTCPGDLDSQVWTLGWIFLLVPLVVLLRALFGRWL